jgi:hypothetical protein
MSKEDTLFEKGNQSDDLSGKSNKTRIIVAVVAVLICGSLLVGGCLLWPPNGKGAPYSAQEATSIIVPGFDGPIYKDNVNQPRPVDGKCPIHVVAYNGDIERLKALLAIPGAEVNLVDNEGYTALHFAASDGHLELVKALIAAPGIDVNQKDKSGRNALHCAASFGYLEIVTVLIANGADVNTQGNYGWTALHHASQNSHLDVVEVLIAKGANVNLVDNEGCTALYYASHVKIAEALKRAVATEESATA